jgi:hypothetical protein
MAAIYLSKCDPNSARRDFHLGDRPLSEIAQPFGVKPKDCRSAMPEEPLAVVVSVREEEARGTEFSAGYYRAAIAPHSAMRHCGIGLSDILGTALEDAESDEPVPPVSSPRQ